MHVVLAVEEITNIHGGVERTVCNLANHLVEHGHDATILTFEANTDQTATYPLDPRVQLYHLNVNPPRASGPTSNSVKDKIPAVVTSILRNLKALSRIVTAHHRKIPALTKAFKTINPDTVISFKTHFHRYVIPAAKQAGVPVIASDHNPYPILYHDYLCTVDRLIIQHHLKAADFIRVLLAPFIKDYPKPLQHKCRAVENGMDIPAGSANLRTTKDNVILNIGRLYFQKDQLTLIKAFAELAPQHPDWRVDIYGDGPEHTRLADAIRTLHMEERIFLRGPASDVLPLYQGAKIFALPSLFEGFGNVTLEALASGLPVVAFDNGDGNNVLIQNGENGLLLPCDNRVTAFAKGLEGLITNEEKRIRMGTNAKACAARFSKDVIMNKWMMLLEEAGQTQPTL